MSGFEDGGRKSKAIHCPSGDQRGVPANPSRNVNRRRPEPSLRPTQISGEAARCEANAIHSPSGEN
jgi:hypothetical protein